MKKKIILLVAAISILSLLGWYVNNLLKNQGKSDLELIEFAIADTTSVDRIIITDPFSQKIEIIRNNGVWTDAAGDCITRENVTFVLEAFKNIEFKGYLPDNSHKQFTKMMSTQHTKVEIFQNGEWTKTWYIGPTASDHYGQIMLLDSEEYGKSDIPVMMKIKGTQGIIEPIFFADKRKWMCTNIFALPMERIAKVDVKYYDEPYLSFSVTKKGNKMAVFQQGKPLSNCDTAMIFRYLQNYKKIHYDLANFELSKKQVDSIKRKMPFATLTVEQNNRKKTKLRLHRIKSDDYQVNEFGDVVSVDMNKFWCELPTGELVKCQYFVFNPLILGHIYFPMDLHERKNTNTNP
jgi:hypothetical protein